MVYEECQKAALNPVLEMPFLIPNTIKRPGDVVVSGLHRGKLTALDVACISTTQTRYLKSAQNKSFNAAEVYGMESKRQGAVACQKKDIAFNLLVVESTSRWALTAL